MAVGAYGNVQTGEKRVKTGSNAAGQPVYTVTPVYTNEALGSEDAIVLDTRLYDGASRELQSGPRGSLPSGYISALVGSNTDLSGATSTTSAYDANGRLLSQHVINEANGSGDYDMAYTGYDAAGNVLSEQMTEGDIRTNYSFAEAKYEGYKEGTVSAVSTNTASGNQTSGVTTESYDVNGNLVGVTDSANGADNRTFVNDFNGQALQKTQQGNVFKQLIVNGDVVGNYGVSVNQEQPTDSNGNPNYIGIYNFNLEYEPVTNSYPAAATGQYPVQSGDTLQSIALAAYGDSSLWYEIADANGLSGNADLKVGEVLTIPTKLDASHSTSNTYAPYDASKVVGSTKPNLPTPAGVPSDDGGGCGGFGALIMVVVAVVVTVVTYGAAAETMGAVLAGALSGAAGSVASQVVGNAIGAEHGFNWGSVAMGAISGAVTAGVGQAMGGGVAAAGNAVGSTPAWLAAAGRAVVGNALSQGIDVAVGLQRSFNWQDVAAAGIGAGVTEGVSDELDTSTSFNDTFGSVSKYAKIGVSDLAGGLTQSIVSGGRVSVVQAVGDAFGNALGSDLVDQMRQGSQQSPYSLGSGMAPSQGLRVSGGQGFTVGSIDNPLGQGLADNIPQFTLPQAAPSYSLGSGDGTGQGLSLNGGLGLNYQGVSAQGSLGGDQAVANTDNVMSNVFSQSSQTDNSGATQLPPPGYWNMYAANDVQDPSQPKVMSDAGGGGTGGFTYKSPNPATGNIDTIDLNGNVLSSEKAPAGYDWSALNRPNFGSLSGPIASASSNEGGVENSDGSITWPSGAISYPVSQPSVEVTPLPPLSAGGVDSMGQPLNGPSNYDAFKKFGEISSGFFDDPFGTIGKLADWATYTVPDAEQKAAAINAQYGGTTNPFLQRIDAMEASPIGGALSGATWLLGGSQQTQDAMLKTGTMLDRLGMSAAALTARPPAFTGASYPSYTSVGTAPDLTLVEGRKGSSEVAGAGAANSVPSLTGVPINGATRTVPLGFTPETQFTAAAQDLLNALTQSGITDATIGVRGSSVTGYSLTKGTQFGPQSDIDFFIESGQLTDGYTTSKNIPGFVHPNKILPDYPLLQDWSTNWTNILGRDVTPGAFVPGTLPVQPSIVVKPIVPGG
ncbi:LysM domain-containing protein [uncultured Herbaspirillum sp.]|uniref:LysM peptidoglycan-binding domain-containing protein n=1 Tax=uncultured Herbaspirillum sp. TaxID=160236 RepID=UPI00258403F3|nr:LysM domain-containing protein [uncultured Herbaspirillum sp.]